ncbi:MAG: hypothetical protein ACK2UM_13960 [Anaerolineales bacterium]|jgi:hypothetical protein
MFEFKRTAIFGLLLTCALLVGCSDLSKTPLPTLYPTQYIPTVIAMTLAAQGIDLEPESGDTTATPITPSPAPPEQPTQTSPPSITHTQPAINPSITPSPPQAAQQLVPTGDIPLSINQILHPGSGSKVISPFILNAAVKPGDNSVVRIELLGQDGQLLMREIRRYQSLETDWLNLGSEITYGINTVAEPGRIQISIEDENGRLKSVSSIDLILQSVGNQDLNQPVDLLEEIVLESPRPNRLIQGGTMRVSGMARPHSTQPFRIEIVTSDGKIVGTRQVSVEPAVGSQYGAFAIDVPYNITYTNRVRVQVWEPGNNIPGIINLSSVEVLLSP